MADRALLFSQALSFTSKHQHNGTRVAEVVVINRAVGRGADDLNVVLTYPAVEWLGSRSHNRLFEQRSHRRPDNRRVERVYAIAEEDESRCTSGGGRSQERTEVPKRANVAERRPARMIVKPDLLECLYSLVKNCSDTRRTFSLGDSTKLFWGHSCEWNSSAFQSSHEFSGNGVDEKFLAVEQGFD